MSTPPLFRWRHFQAEILLLNVRWYCRYALSYRDLESMMQKRGVAVDHSTINRWVLKYAPELDLRIRPHLRSTNDSWRVDETYIKVKKFILHWSSWRRHHQALARYHHYLKRSQAP